MVRHEPTQPIWPVHESIEAVPDEPPASIAEIDCGRIFDGNRRRVTHAVGLNDIDGGTYEVL
jgi:hypothetical protein